jgi:amino acid permease
LNLYAYFWPFLNRALLGLFSLQGLWGRTIGEKSTILVDAIIALMCLSSAVIYSCILGDVFTPLLAQAGLPDQWNGRSTNILAITSLFLLPLSLIKDLSALAFTSVLGFAAIIYTVVFIVIRAVDGSYKLGSGKFVTDGLLLAQPAFKKSSMWNIDFTSLILASNLGLAYIAHYNGPNYYRSLKDANAKRFRKMVNISFAILVAIYVTTTVAGYSTFGDACQGNILLNYHPDDILSTLGRLATGFSILFGFPLVATGAREAIAGVAASLGFERLGSEQNHFTLVFGILSLVTFISCTVTDVSLVVGLTGALLGSFIVYVCPPLIYTKAMALAKGEESPEHRASKINLALVPFGIFVATVGCFMTLKEAAAGK